MSYILNALRKSEQERQQNNAELLESKIQSHPVSPSKISVGLGVLVLLNLLLLSYFIWSEIKQEAEVVKKSAEPLKQELQKKQAVELKGEGEKVIPLSQERSKKPPVLSIAEQLERKKKASRPVVKKPEIKMTSSKSIISAPSLIKPKKIERIKKEGHKQVNKIPFLSELNSEFRRAVPVIAINVYVYAEKKQDRFIMIAMRKYQVGQEVAPGMVLKDIAVKSLVVEYKNKVFQIKR